MKKIQAITAVFLFVAISGWSQNVTEGINIDSLLNEMSLIEKIGQLTLITSDWDITGPSLSNDYKELIKAGKAGAVFNAYTVDFVRELQKTAVEETRLKIPLLFGYDVIHGHRTIFPIPLGQAASWNLDLIRRSESVAASEATAEGINWIFAPMVDISRDPRWGRVSEGGGEDTWLTSKIGATRVNGFQGEDLSSNSTALACVKHFAAYGAPEAGREYNTVDISTTSLFESYLPPYKAGIDAGTGSVMTSFNEINGQPSTSNKWLLTDLLRDQWDFKGFVVSDYTSINELVNHGVAEDEKSAALLSLNAGVDMDMQGRAFLNNLEMLIAGDKISMQQIDQAVRRILIAKAKLGLFDDPYRYCNKKREKTAIMTKDNRILARKLVRESCVLLKNENNTLPIPDNVKSIAIIGPLGDSKKDMLGNWIAAGEWDKCITLKEGMVNRAGDLIKVTFNRGCGIDDANTSGFEEALKAARNADMVILALGEAGEMSGEAASRTNIDLPGVQNQLATMVMEAGKPTVAVLFNGRPLAISQLQASVPAILETWFGGTEAGNGIADVLFGDYNPAGKLTMTFPQNLGQVPIYYNHKNTGRPLDPERPDFKYLSKYIDSPNDPLYPFGYGLSYTTFKYDDLSVNVEGSQIQISVNVANTGNRDGEEVVQLYVQDKIGSITRPVKELKGFQKLMIKKGESKTVQFTLTKDDLAFYHPDLTKSFEPGEFVVYVGGNSVETIQKLVLFD